ncbi:hypothetical protein POM88_016742 [Heracleum sosnowskyi]|uniref:Uncharacterized protein n=1 Tax=Heracleum sosnowskyi TaxID=360622 RepID=A0AAD8MXD3_9APIA|nr:hypothetical protein POM88_016742 [Heracleum sosnowskyi]
MATQKYDSFKDLRKGKYDWKVQERVMNLWRGYTKKGEPFKAFNLLLLDSKRCRIHTFVPGHDYKEEEKFRIRFLRLSISERTFNLNNISNRCYWYGKTNFNVTLWDQLAEHFDEAIREEDFETPLIIIIGCGRVTKWIEEVDASNVGATSFYINYNHHCVSLLRTMLSENYIKKFKKSMVKKEPPRQITIQEMKELGYDEIEKEYLCTFKVKKVDKQDKWLKNICTSCYNETIEVEKINSCLCGPRDVPYPDKWYNLCIRATDDTAEIDIVRENVAGQKCYGKHAYEMLDKIDENVFPEGLKTIEGKEYTMKLAKKGNGYVAKDVSHVIDFENFTMENEDAQPRPIQESYAEGSTTTYHL